MNHYKTLFSALNQAKIEYLIIGGVAVNLYGYSRFTSDVDIIVLVTDENLARIDNLAKKLNFTARQPISIKTLNNQQEIDNLLKEKNFLAFTYLSNEKLPLDIDILTNESLNFEKFNSKKTIIKIWDLELPVINIDDLIELKQNSNRTKDLEDLEALLKFKADL
jgi:predicted nucleotidyltransferase